MIVSLVIITSYIIHDNIVTSNIRYTTHYIAIDYVVNSQLTTVSSSFVCINVCHVTCTHVFNSSKIVTTRNCSAGPLRRQDTSIIISTSRILRTLCVTCHLLNLNYYTSTEWYQLRYTKYVAKPLSLGAGRGWCPTRPIIHSVQRHTATLSHHLSLVLSVV